MLFFATDKHCGTQIPATALSVVAGNVILYESRLLFYQRASGVYSRSKASATALNVILPSTTLTPWVRP